MDIAPDPPVEAPELLLAVLAGVDAAAAAVPVEAESAAALATGFTSTVLSAAAALRVVRRRLEGEGVTMDRKKRKRNGTEEVGENSLSVRIPEVDDATDGEVG